MFTAVKVSFNNYQIFNTTTNAIVGIELSQEKAEAIVAALNAKNIDYIGAAALAAETEYTRCQSLAAELMIDDPNLSYSYSRAAIMEKELAQNLRNWIGQQ